jgi:DNA-binding NarL/FixJ family response regulator
MPSQVDDRRRNGTVRRGQQQAVVDHSRTTMARTAELLDAHRERLSALRATAAEHRVLRGAPATAEPAAGRAAASAELGLTPRQLEILGYLGEGLTTKQIAQRLWLSSATVRNHVHAVLLALECHSRLQAVAKAHRLHLI